MYININVAKICLVINNVEITVSQCTCYTKITLTGDMSKYPIGSLIPKG